MRKVFVFLITSFYLGTSFAQLSAIPGKSKEFKQFKSSTKTYIVKTGDVKFDKELLNAMTEVWKATPFEAISEGIFKRKVSDKTASFILLVDIEKDSREYNYLILINGGGKSLDYYGYQDCVAYCPINHFVDEPRNTDCYFRVRNMVESIITTIDLLDKTVLNGNSIRIVEQLQEIYNEKSKLIKDRTLLFCSESMGAKFSKSELEQLYPYKFEVCDRKKIEQVIKDKSTEYYYFQPCITLNKSMFVFDPSNGEVVYFDYQVMGENINKKNIKDLVKAIKED